MSGFSEKLAFYRAAVGMTQAELASKLSISKSAISMYERGNREPELQLLEAMANALGISVATLLGQADPTLPAGAECDPELAGILRELSERPEMRMLFSVTRGAKREDIEAAVRIIEALQGKK